MFSNIGKKLKLLAKIVFIFLSSACVIGGIALVAANIDLLIIAVPVLLVGPLFAWIGSWFLYGFGELVDKACDIERNTRGETGVRSEAQKKHDSLRATKIETLRTKELITEEEYQFAINKQNREV